MADEEVRVRVRVRVRERESESESLLKNDTGKLLYL